MKEKIYISGKISGLPLEKVKAKFELAEQKFLRQNYEVVNPLKLVPKADAWKEYMKKDINALLDCDVIYLCRDWAESKGARLEAHIASEMGMEIIFEL